MMIRHRPTDVVRDVDLPPLTHKTIFLEPCLQNKLTLNVFTMMVTINAITSERKDADYFFHPKQRKHLQTLVSNMRQGSFFWSGWTSSDIRSATDNVKKFLDLGTVPVTAEDHALLKQALILGDTVTTNGIYTQVSEWHEMPMFVQFGDEVSEDLRQALSLDISTKNPTLAGATMVQ